MIETDAVAERYARRSDSDERYSPLRPEVQRWLAERQRVLLTHFARAGITRVQDLRLVEVGCGGGGNLLELLQLGFSPAHLHGIELLRARWEQARERLPAALTLTLGDACEAQVAPASQDLVLQSTVFSSLLDEAFQQRLADTMWRWLAPGGAVIWYDLRVDNPHNRDVRGLPLGRIGALFPQATVRAKRVTLAPPIARAACALHPRLHDLLNLLPPLRSHLLAWVAKPR